MELRRKKKTMSELIVILNDNSVINEAFFFCNARCSIYVILVMCFRQCILCVFITFMFQLVFANIL